METTAHKLHSHRPAAVVGGLIVVALLITLAVSWSHKAAFKPLGSVPESRSATTTGTLSVPNANTGSTTVVVSPIKDGKCNGQAVASNATGCTSNGGAVYGAPPQILNAQGQVVNPSH